MDINLAFFVELFFHVLGMWWVIVPSILLGLVVGAIPGFSAANTIIILLSNLGSEFIQANKSEKLDDRTKEFGLIQNIKHPFIN